MVTRPSVRRGWRRFPAGLAILLAAAGAAVQPDTGQHPQTLRSAEGGIVQRFLLYLPEAYRRNDRKWPLLLYLHGARDRGEDLELVRRGELPRMLEERKDFPSVVVSPQCPEERFWDFRLLESLVALATSRYAIDPDRVYATGLSMGGFGAWDLASLRPDLFAAIAPIAGSGDPARACALKDVPVWAFHGDRDPIVALSEDEKMVAAVNACGGKARLTIYPDTGHDAWTATYANPKVFEWLLEQKRTSHINK